MTVATTVSPRSAPRSRMRQREDRHDLVAVDHRAGGVDRQAAVGVAVVGDAEVGAVLDDGGLEPVQVGGAAAVVDVEPVGLARRSTIDLGAGRARTPRATTRRRRRAPRRGRPCSPSSRCGSTRQQMGDVAVGAVGVGR